MLAEHLRTRRSVLLKGAALITSAFLVGGRQQQRHPGPAISTLQTAQVEEDYSERRFEAHPAQPETEPETVDMLKYYTGKGEKGLEGTHFLSTYIDPKNKWFFLVKDRSGKMFEMHTWNDTFIRLVIDVDPNRTYTLTHGIFAARYMKVGEEITVSRPNDITFYKKRCVPDSTMPYDYQIELEQINLSFDCSGDLGKQKIAVLKYTPLGGYPERFYLSGDWGLVRWEEWEKDESELRASSFFNRIVEENVKPDFSSICIPPNK